MTKKDIRSNFRLETFKRANYKCEKCGAKGYDHNSDDEPRGVALDAHHITPRDELPNGGYVRSNSISLCPHCHLMAEFALNNDRKDPYYGPEVLYKLICSSYERAIEDSSKLKEVA